MDHIYSLYPVDINLLKYPWHLKTWKKKWIKLIEAAYRYYREREILEGIRKSGWVVWG